LQVGIRWGHFYAYTLVEHLFTTISPNTTQDEISDAVVRISLVHYNTVEEVERMVKVLDGVLFG
jgi:selenocysteine lyase/cysteine desulfurase